MKNYFVYLLFLLSISACTQYEFIAKPNQSLKKFETDQAYCRSEANGVWTDQSGTTTVGIRSKQMGNQTYEQCMRQLGYQQK